MLQLVFTQNKNQIFAQYCRKTAAAIIHKDQNQIFTKYCDKTVAASIHKE
jgi:regulator of extracellular matrix RemA (YlzA/DUF370 family)